jgi:hypothetical protein
MKYPSYLQLLQRRSGSFLGSESCGCACWFLGGWEAPRASWSINCWSESLDFRKSLLSPICFPRQDEMF